MDDVRETGLNSALSSDGGEDVSDAVRGTKDVDACRGERRAGGAFPVIDKVSSSYCCRRTLRSFWQASKSSFAHPSQPQPADAVTKRPFSFIAALSIAKS